MKTVIHWFRRDLRLTDNTALAQAFRRAERVIPLFIVEDALRTGPDVGAARLSFLLRCVESLGRDLAALGHPLIIRRGQAELELLKICRETKAAAVFCNRRYEPYAQARDNRIISALNQIGVGFEQFKDAVLWEERDLLTRAGTPFTVFTPYAKSWKSMTLASPHPKIKAALQRHLPISSDPLPSNSEDLGHPLAQSMASAGEGVAERMLNRFLREGALSYGQRRDFPALGGTSQLSAHLRAGTIGIRTVLGRLAGARATAPPEGQASCDTFLNELIWREFYLQILANFPHVMRGSFRPEHDALEWPGHREHFEAWCQGQTGYPIIDGAMRCLNATGWMHNRLRMIVAMFLTKDLLIHWQWGERYFMQQLVDGDLAANNGGWQWSAGTGTDAAPYFRIFNPTTQAEKFDPDGAFVRQWVPELAEWPADRIHQPWTDATRASQCGYPLPIVVHAEQREKFLRMFKAVLSSRRAPASDHS